MLGKQAWKGHSTQTDRSNDNSQYDILVLMTSTQIYSRGGPFYVYILCGLLSCDTTGKQLMQI